MLGKLFSFTLLIKVRATSVTICIRWESIYVIVCSIYMPGEKGTLWEWIVFPKNTIYNQQGPLDRESGALTISLSRLLFSHEGIC